MFGLSERVKNERATHELLVDLKSLVGLSIRIDSHMREGCRERQLAVPVSPPRPQLTSPTCSVDHFPCAVASSASATHSGGEEPMQLGRVRLSEEEKLHHIRA